MDGEDEIIRISQGDVIKDVVSVKEIEKLMNSILEANMHRRNTDVPAASQLDSIKRRTNGRILRFIAAIFSMVVGAIHFNDCPAQKKLPRGLVIFGGLRMVSDVLYYVLDYQRTVKGETIENIPFCLKLLSFVTEIFVLTQYRVLIALCYWSYSTTPTTKPEDYDLQNYCDNSVYKTSICLCIIMLLPAGERILYFFCLVCLRIRIKIISIIRNIEALFLKPF